MEWGGSDSSNQKRNISRPFNWKKKNNNLAAVLVTQVPYGGTKPYISPLIDWKEYTNKNESIVIGEQKEKGKKTLVLDLDETLVHSSFESVDNCDLVLPVEIEGKDWNIYVLKRPGVDLFLKKMSLVYEIVIYTASLPRYANPLLDWLDPNRLCTYRLFREDCTFYNGIFVKNLSKLGRNLKDTIIIDNSPASYLMHSEWALPITSWYDDMEDTELYMLTPILEWLAKVEDVRNVLKQIVSDDRVLFNKAWQVLQGGKVLERTHSLQPHLKPANIIGVQSEVVITSNTKIEKLDAIECNESENVDKTNESSSILLIPTKPNNIVSRKSRTGLIKNQK